ncbi:EI24 domain-containing protein, partial [Agromyces mediolanus]|nr:EI24 domain-containing protein [Agromyces mediolanus]
MFTALALSLAQLGDRAILSVLRKSLLLTLAVFILLGGALWWGVNRLLEGWTYNGSLAAAAALIVSMLALWLTFRAVAIAIVGLYADTIVAAVESR